MKKIVVQSLKTKAILLLCALAYVFGLYLSSAIFKSICLFVFYSTLTYFYYQQTHKKVDHAIFISYLVLICGETLFINISPFYETGLFLIAIPHLIRGIVNISAVKKTARSTFIFYYLLFFFVFLSIFIFVIPKDIHLIENILLFFYGFSAALFGSVTFISFLNKMNYSNNLLVRGVLFIIFANATFTLSYLGMDQLMFETIDNFLNFTGHYMLTLGFIMIQNNKNSALRNA